MLYLNGYSVSFHIHTAYAICDSTSGPPEICFEFSAFSAPPASGPAASFGCESP